MALLFGTAGVNPATMELLRSLDVLTGRLERAVTSLEDTLEPEPEPEPAEPAERATDD